MAELNPWDEGYVAPEVTSEQPTELNPWDEGYSPKIASDVPMDIPTAEELQKYSQPVNTPVRQGEMPSADLSQGFTEEEANTIPLGDMDVLQTIQANRNQAVADEYKDFQSGPNAGKSLGAKFVPSTDMYDNSQEPEKLYEMAKKQADGSTLLGDPTIDGVRVPRPGEYDWVGLPTTSINPYKKVDALTGDALREGTKNALVTGAAILDELGATNRFAEWVNKNIADPPKAKDTDALIKDAVKITAATVAGSKVGYKVSAPVTGERIATALAGLGGLFSGIAVMNPDDPTMFTGKHAMIPLIEGAENPDGTYSGEIIASKINQLRDAVAVAYPAAKGTQAMAWVGNFFKKSLDDIVTGLPFEVSNKARHEKLTQKIAYELDAKDPESLDRLTRLLRENKEEVFQLGGKLPDAVVERTPMSAINEGAVKEGDFLLANKALEIEKGGLESGVSELITRKEQPIRELDSVLKVAIEDRGGPTTIEASRKLLADQAISKLDEAGNIRKVAQAKSEADVLNAQNTLNDRLTQTELQGASNVGIAEGQLDEVNSELQNMYQKDTTFAETIDSLSKDSGIDVANRFRTNETKKLLPEMIQSVVALRKKKNDLYNAIPDGAVIDIDSFSKSIAPLVDNKWLPMDVESAIAKRLEDGSMDGADFRFVYKELLPKVNADISRELAKEGSANFDRLRALEGLRDNISIHQMDVLENSPDADVAAAATAARDFYRDTYAKYAKEYRTPLGRLFNEIDGNEYFVNDLAQNVVEKGVKDETLGTSQQVIDFMRNPDYQGDPKGLLKVYKGEVAGAIADQIAQGKSLADLDPAVIYKTLKDKGVVLKDNFPEEVKEIDTFIEQFRNAKANQKGAQLALEKAQKEASDTIAQVKAENKDILSTVKEQAKTDLKAGKKDAKKLETEVKKGALNKFVETGPDGPIPKKNGYEVLKTLMTKKGGQNRVEEIAGRIQKAGDKDAQKGLESTYWTSWQELAKSKSNAKRLNPTKVGDILDPEGDIQKNGEIIFGNIKDPKEREASLNSFRIMSKFLEGVRKEQAKVSDTSIPLGQQLSVQKDAQSAVGFLTRMVLGPLNRLGTQVQGTGGRILKYSDPDAHMKELRAKMLSDPDFLEESFDNLKQKLKNGLTKEEANALRQAGVTLTILEGEKKGEDLKKKYLAPSELK